MQAPRFEVCAILAPAGPQRARVLAALCKDERISRVQHYEILRKVLAGEESPGDGSR